MSIRGDLAMELLVNIMLLDVFVGSMCFTYFVFDIIIFIFDLFILYYICISL